MDAGKFCNTKYKINAASHDQSRPEDLLQENIDQRKHQCSQPEKQGSVVAALKKGDVLLHRRNEK